MSKKLGEFTKADIEEWKHHPVTRAFVADLASLAENSTRSLARDAAHASESAIRTQAGFVLALGTVIEDMVPL